MLYRYVWWGVGKFVLCVVCSVGVRCLICFLVLGVFYVYTGTFDLGLLVLVRVLICG